MATALVALGFALFASHGVTVEGYALTDLMTFLDWINSLEQDRVPHVDFHTPVGALGYILPYLGSQMSGRFAGAMESAGVLVAAMLLGCSGQEGVGRSWLMGAAVVAFVLSFLFFLKMTYFLVAFAFVVGFGLLLRRFMKAALAGLAAFLVVVLAVQATAGLVLPYLQQVGGTIQATGLVWTAVLRINLLPILPLCAIAASAGILTLRRKSVPQDAAMLLFGL